MKEHLYTASCSLVFLRPSKDLLSSPSALACPFQRFCPTRGASSTDLAEERRPPTDLPTQKAELLSVENFKMFLFHTNKNFYTTQHQYAGDFTSQDQVSNRRGLIALIRDSH